LIGFIGLYFVLGLLFLFLEGREIGRGPEDALVVGHGERQDVMPPKEEHFV
jgi:hypothetical protein